MKKLLMIGALLLSGSVFGADWIELGETPAKEKGYLDLDSIKPMKIKVMGFDFNEPIYSFFIQETYLKGHKLRQQGYYYTKINYYMACNNGMYFKNAVFAYDTKNNLIDSWKYSKSYISSSDFVPVIPDTIGELMYDIVCISSN